MQLLEDVKKNKVKNIEKMCNKRVKDLHFKNEDLKQMEDFVQMMESIL